MPHLYVGTHVEFLESGRPLVNGDTVDTVDKADQRLIDAGLLVPSTTSPEPPAAAPAPETAPATTDLKEPDADAPRA